MILCVLTIVLFLSIRPRIPVLNSTFQFAGDEFGRANGMPSDAADVLYQRDASFIARLDNPPNASYDDAFIAFGSGGSNDGDLSGESLGNRPMSNDIDDDDTDDDDDGDADDDGDDEDALAANQPQTESNGISYARPAKTTPTRTTTTTTTPASTTAAGATGQPAAPYDAPQAGNYYALSMEDMSVYDDVNNNRLNLPPSPEQMYANSGGPLRPSSTSASAHASSTTEPAAPVAAAASDPAAAAAAAAVDSTSHSYIRIDVYNANDGANVAGAAAAWDQSTAAAALAAAGTITEDGASAAKTATAASWRASTAAATMSMAVATTTLPTAK